MRAEAQDVSHWVRLQHPSAYVWVWSWARPDCARLPHLLLLMRVRMGAGWAEQSSSVVSTGNVYKLCQARPQYPLVNVRFKADSKTSRGTVGTLLLG